MSSCSASAIAISRKVKNSLTCLAAFLLLAGCATMPKGVDLPPMSTWDERQAVLAEQPRWDFKGRMGVKAGDEGFNAKFYWAQHGDSFETTVSGPLGIGTVLIEGDERRVVLTDKDGEKTELVNPEAELWYRYGWTIPVGSLRYWALGIPDPRLPSETEFNDEGQLEVLHQGNWTVKISRYREAAGQLMPRTLTATNPDTRVRMVIDRWSFFDR